MIESMIADRMGRLGTESAFEVLARARALEARGRRSSTSRSASRTSTRRPTSSRPAIEALKKGGRTTAPPAGLPDLREAIAERHRSDARLPAGARRGDRLPGREARHVLPPARARAGRRRGRLPEPRLPDLRVDDPLRGAKAVPCPILEENDFSLRPGRAREAASRRRRSCSSSTRRATRRAACSTARRSRGSPRSRGEHSFLDPLRRDLRPDHLRRRARSIAALDGLRERTVILDGFSKAYAMTGWRLGYGVGPRDVIQQMTKLQINSASCTASFTQMAGIEALNGPQDAVARRWSRRSASGATASSRA